MKKSYRIAAAASVVLIIGIVLAFQNCGRAGALRSASSEGANDKASSAEISSLYTEIEELRLQNLTCQTDADCEAIALGAKACGGPSKYIIVSTLNPALEQIDGLVAELEQKERAFNQESGLMSTCEALTERMPVCQQNICQ